MARHPDVVAAVLGSGRTKARSQLVELEKKLPALNREITQVTQQMNNVVDALAKGGLVVLDDELRGRVEDLRRRKDELLIKREHLEQDGEVLRQEQLAPDKICAALARFDTLWEQMSPEEKRELVELTVARVELRRSAKGEDAMEARPRGLQMQFQLHLPELLVSDGTATSTSKKKLLTIDADVQLPNKSGGDVVITAPFKHRISAPASQARKHPKAALCGAQHPIHHALALERLLVADPRLTPQQLAIKEGVSPSSVCQWRKLTRLCPAVQEALLEIDDRATAWRCSIRRLLPLVTLSPATQWQKFEEVRRAKRPRPKLSVATRRP